jgi:preprotein translocase subunit SecG
MRGFVLFIQFFSGISLIIAVLLHSAKGEGLGSIGGGARMFGSQKGLEEGLNKVTAILSTIFMFTSALLGFFL